MHVLWRAIGFNPRKPVRISLCKLAECCGHPGVISQIATADAIADAPVAHCQATCRFGGIEFGVQGAGVDTDLPQRGDLIRRRLIAEQLRGYAGVLQVDGYAAYNGLTKTGRKPGPIKLAFCMAHAR